MNYIVTAVIDTSAITSTDAALSPLAQSLGTEMPASSDFMKRGSLVPDVAGRV